MSGFDFGNLGNFDWANGVQSSTGDTWSVPSDNIPLPSGIGDLFTDFSAGPSTGFSGFFDSLAGQVKNIGNNALKNPIGALGSALGAYGTYKENTGGKIPEGTIDAVEQLMLKGDIQNTWKPSPVKFGQPVARDSRHYVQSYGLDGKQTNENSNDAHVSDLYKTVLGRNADAGGQDFWSDIMDRQGMTPGQLYDKLNNSSEARVNRAYQDQFARRPDLEGSKYWISALDNGSTVQDMRAQMGLSEENAVNSLYREELGRNPDIDGFAHFHDALRNKKMTIDDIRKALAGSPEGVKFDTPKPTPAPAPAPVAGGLAQAAPVPGVPTGVAPRPGKLSYDQQYNLE